MMVPQPEEWVSKSLEDDSTSETLFKTIETRRRRIWSIYLTVMGHLIVFSIYATILFSLDRRLDRQRMTTELSMS